jgi:hypothetical protein
VRRRPAEKRAAAWIERPWNQGPIAVRSPKTPPAMTEGQEMCIELKLPRDWVIGKSAEEKSLMDWDNIAVKNKKEWWGLLDKWVGGRKV